MSATSIHIKPCLGGSEKHNTREKELDYIKKELTKDNESFVLQSTKDCLADIKARYEKTTGQKMQSKATPIREGVVVIEQNTTMAQLQKFSNELEKRFGIKTIQIHTHKDEGHNTIDKEWKPNLHAHMVFNWTDDKGKSLKLNKQDMAEIQTILAKSISMDRGKSSDVKHLNIIQYKIDKRSEEFEQLVKKNQELKNDLSNLELKKTAGKAGKAVLGSIERVFGNDKLHILQNEYDEYRVKANKYIEALNDKHTNEIKEKDLIIKSFASERSAILEVFPSLENAQNNIKELHSLRLDEASVKRVLIGERVNYNGSLYDERNKQTYQGQNVIIEIAKSTDKKNLVWTNRERPFELLTKMWESLKQSLRKDVSPKRDNNRGFGIS